MELLPYIIIGFFGGLFLGVNIGVLLMGVLAAGREWESTEDRA